MALWPSMAVLLILLVLSCIGEVSSLGEKGVLSLRKLQWAQTGDGRSCFSQKSRTQNGATILEMKHQDYCSGPIRDWERKLQKLLIADDVRVRSIQSQFKNVVSTQVETQIPISSGVRVQTLNYIVTVALGGRNLTMIVDTGSDLAWVQCQPCKLCYSQPEPLFNPLISPSYQSLQCNSQACHTLQFATGNSGSCGNNAPTCNYVVTYGDGSYSHGELGSDHLVLGTTPVENFVFGCGRNNKGLFGAASGLMGLGRSDLSLISQTSNVFGEFSHTACLILMLQLLLSKFWDGGNSYRLRNRNHKATSIYLHGHQDRVLETVLGYPPAPSFSILDTCFNLSAYAEVNIPTLKLWFEGDGQMSVDVSGMFYFVKRDASQVCLALASLAYEDEIGIIGNYQQRNTRVIYDTQQMKVGFAREMCSFS
ncbi:UNVERIFIED_CONTAM: protein ASPARTIC PROTEASE IN GUARD CELL 2 [Sesamum calycinum]|uniref:Protein ASPARTIC PROTEASE IN GUARD CELL 2 n=1 Tax=Sesamum calycinum TaxID=2727403 RepID=A0AAW2SY58_9LAMI